MMNRKIGISTFFTLLMNRPIVTIITAGSVAMITLQLMMVITFLSIFDSHSENLSYDEIANNGDVQTAVIYEVIKNTNTTVNGENPNIIKYHSKHINDSLRGKTQLMPDVSFGFNVGVTINVKYYQGQSIIEGKKPYEFPFKIFLFIPFIFGLIFFVPALIWWKITFNKFNVYKKGTIIEGSFLYAAPINTWADIVSRIKVGFKVESDYYEGTSIITDLDLINRISRLEPIKILKYKNAYTVLDERLFKAKRIMCE